MKFSGKVGNGLTNKRLSFGGDPDQGSGSPGYGSGPDPNPYPDTSKTCLGGGMGCLTDSSLC